MSIVLSSTATTGKITVNGVDVVSVDASGNVSVRTGGTLRPVADLRSIGDGQTWQDVTGDRAVGTTYTNTTGRSIVVSIITTTGSSGASVTLTVGGVVVDNKAVSSSVPSTLSVSAIVPPGATYSYTSRAIASWLELR